MTSINYRPSSKKLAGRTIFITGASRGIGKAIALKCAKDGANIVIAARTAQPHPKLSGTIYTAAEEVEKAGGKCLPCIVDIREEDQIQKAVEVTVKKFGGIDILVNNASAIPVMTGTAETSMKKYDLMHHINTRGTFLTSKLCLPYLKLGRNPHILNISPPLNLNPKWFQNHVAYTIAKFGVSMCVLGMSEEFKSDCIAVNALWPQTAIYTAAMDRLAGEDVSSQCRSVDIMSDAAYVIFNRDSKSFTGNFCIDEKILREEGETDFEKYALKPGHALIPDLFLDAEEQASSGSGQLASARASGSTAGMFAKISKLISDEHIKKIAAVYQFDLSGGESGVWHMDLKNSSGATGPGAPLEKPDVTISMTSEDFVKMFSGNLKPITAHMTGKLKIKGDMGLVLKLEQLIGNARSKL